MLGGIARARLWLDAIMTGRVDTANTLADQEGIGEHAVEQMLSLAFLAPDIVEAAASGSVYRPLKSRAIRTSHWPPVNGNYPPASTRAA